MKAGEGSRRFPGSKNKSAPGGRLAKIKLAPSSSMLKINLAPTGFWQKNYLASRGLRNLSLMRYYVSTAARSRTKITYPRFWSIWSSTAYKSIYPPHQTSILSSLLYTPCFTRPKCSLGYHRTQHLFQQITTQLQHFPYLFTWMMITIQTNTTVHTRMLIVVTIDMLIRWIMIIQKSIHKTLMYHWPDLNNKYVTDKYTTNAHAGTTDLLLRRIMMIQISIQPTPMYHWPAPKNDDETDKYTANTDVPLTCS